MLAQVADGGCGFGCVPPGHHQFGATPSRADGYLDELGASVFLLAGLERYRLGAVPLDCDAAATDPCIVPECDFFEQTEVDRPGFCLGPSALLPVRDHGDELEGAAADFVFEDDRPLCFDSGGCARDVRFCSEHDRLSARLQVLASIA